MKKNIKFIPYIILVCILFISLGYATFSSKMTIFGITASVRPERNIRVTNFYATGSENNGWSYWEEYSINRIASDVIMPQADSTVSYKVQITNLGGISMSVTDIAGLPDNMEIVFTDYEYGETLCDDSKNEEPCKYGAQDEFTITIKYKEDGFNSEVTEYQLRLDLTFNCIYTVVYHQLMPLLPEEYQEVEYIESTGTQRINTGYIPKINTKMELDLSFSGDFDISSGTVGTGTFFSSSDNGNVFSVNFGSAASQGNNLFTWFDKNQANGGSIHYYDTNDSVRTKRSTMMYEKGIFKYGTSNQKTVAVKTVDHTTPLYLFGTSAKNFDRYNMKVYRLKFSEDGVLVSDYVPCYRISDGKVGLYELVGGTFHTNIGTGEFNKGAEVDAEYQEVASQELEYDVPEKLDANTYSRPYHSFYGWNTQPDGSGIGYVDGQEVVNLSTTNGDKINLYATWEPYKNYAGYYVYNVVKEDAVMDNISSKYVNNANGIDFFDKSSTTNGNGKYILSATANDEFPTYYYRGDIKNNNVLFAGHCWKIVRTTDSGGTKLIYNGKPVDGKCDNIGLDTFSHNGVYFATVTSTSVGLASAGYSYTEKSKLVTNTETSGDIVAGTIFANDVEYVEITDEATGTTSWQYRLIGEKVTSTGTKASEFNAEREALLKEHHYTCFSTTDDVCSKVKFVYMVRDNNNYYATFSNGLLLEDYLNIEFNGNSTNATPSTLHSTVNTWYNNNLLDVDHYIEDTVFCNDRSLYQPWTNTSSVANNDDEKTHFGAKARIAYTGGVTVNCPNVADSFTSTPHKGNNALSNPIGLLTLDEVVLAGYAWGMSATDNYLYTGDSKKIWWTMSPGFISATGVYPGVVYSTLDTVGVNYRGSKITTGVYSGGGVRPVISLRYGTTIKDCIGTVDDPFSIEEMTFVSATDIYDPNNENANMLHIGDFVNYDAGTWTQEEINSIKVGPVASLVSPNNSLEMPSIDYQFGGFKVGTSRNSTTVAPVFSGLGEVKYINNSKTNKPITGWRVYDINQTTGEVTLISAGNPEGFYQTNVSDAGYSTPYIFSGTIHSDWGEENAALYQKRNWDSYINESYGATSAYILSKSDLETWYTKYLGSSGDLWTQENFKKIYSYPRLHNIIDNYSFWWLSSTRAAAGPHFVQGDEGRRLRGGNSVALGVRINVVLSSNAKFIPNKVGTVELTSEHLTGYDGNQVYNVWDLKTIQ